jgi:GT2 family glycosyltransferase
VTFLDDDDLYAPTKIQHQVDTARMTGTSVVTNSWIRFNEFGPLAEWVPRPDKHLPPGLSYAEALMTGNFVSNGLLVRIEILRELGGFDEKLNACEDWDLWRRIAYRHEIVYVDEPLVHIRVHATNMSSRWWLMTANALKHLVKMHFDTPDNLRYMLPRARLVTLNRLFPLRTLPSEIYESLNRSSGGRIRLWVRAIKRHLKKPA